MKDGWLLALIRRWEAHADECAKRVAETHSDGDNQWYLGKTGGIGFCVEELRRHYELESLLPCPFCGGAAKLEIYRGDNWCECVECKCSMPFVSTSEKAVAAWNTTMILLGAVIDGIRRVRGTR